MAKKKTTDKPSKQEVFRSNSFIALKGVVASASVKSSDKPVPVTPPVTPPVTLDADLFLEAMNDVKPLNKLQPAKQTSAKKAVPACVPPLADQRNVLARTEEETFAKAISQLKLDVTFSDEFPENDEIKSIGANRIRQLKKGIIKINRELDLHGLTREEALNALPGFLRNASAYGEKAVLVITGKGLNSPGEPVLQQAVAGWLRDAGKKLVLEFGPAPQNMGGVGAFIVFLRS